jgi:hypothetical protein
MLARQVPRGLALEPAQEGDGRGSLDTSGHVRPLRGSPSQTEAAYYGGRRGTRRRPGGASRLGRSR